MRPWRPISEQQQGCGAGGMKSLLHPAAGRPAARLHHATHGQTLGTAVKHLARWSEDHVGELQQAQQAYDAR